MYAEYGPLYLDDFPIDSSNEDLMIRIINSLPDNIINGIIDWYCSDTVVKESIFEFLCQKIGFDTCDKYYESDIAKNYFEKQIYLSNEMLDKILV